MARMPKNISRKLVLHRKHKAAYLDLLGINYPRDVANLRELRMA
jgi:hypothetical protein